jgi:Cu+-exporting ATPase
LPAFIGFARRSIRLVYGAYAFALVYNIIGLSYAVQGALSPIVAAILMPLSSISIVLFGVLSSNLIARKTGLTGLQGGDNIPIDKSHSTS